MDRSDIITLVAVTQTQDEFGVWRETPTPRDVYCDVDSVTRAEFYDGGRNGLNPEYKMTMFSGDYEGEKTVVYKGQYYGVYRTFKARGDDIELYVERKGGANRGENNG